MIGSEHLSCLLSRDRTGGRVIGAELREALRIAHDELGVRAVRAHAILDDDLGVYTESGGRAVHDFTGIDRVYDELMEIGLRPVVELSFMPARPGPRPGPDGVQLRGDHLPAQGLGPLGGPGRRPGRPPDPAVRPGRGGIALGVRGVERAQPGGVLVRHAGGVLPALRRLGPRDQGGGSGLRVGGPASAAAGWIWELLGHLEGSDAPLDFLSTHVYGNVPLDLRPVLAAFGRAGTPIWWTEWGTTPTHFHDVGDTVFAAAFLLRGMASAMGRIEALSHWVASDHFEELGRAPDLFHGGFGLLSVGNLRKPRYWAMAMLARLGRSTGCR